MFPGPNASANVVLNIITDVEAHHALFLYGQRLAAPVALLCLQIRGDFVSEGARVQFEVIDRTSEATRLIVPPPQYAPGPVAANTSEAMMAMGTSFRTMDERGL
jgi:hypothetical protein